MKYCFTEKYLLAYTALCLPKVQSQHTVQISARREFAKTLLAHVIISQECPSAVT